MALVLNRDIGERVVIDGRIVVWISRSKRNSNQLRLHIDAPADVSIVREELIGQPPSDGDRKAA